MLGVTPQYIYKIGQGWIDPLLPPPGVQSAFSPQSLQNGSNRKSNKRTGNAVGRTEGQV